MYKSLVEVLANNLKKVHPPKMPMLKVGKLLIMCLLLMNEWIAVYGVVYMDLFAS